MQKKVGNLLLALSLLLSMLVGLATPAKAAPPYDPSQIKISVHKLIFKEGFLPESQDMIKNNGALLDDAAIKGFFGAEANNPEFGYTWLEDAEFTIFDITDKYYEMRDAGKEPKDIMTEIQNENKDIVQSYATPVGNPAKTDANGLVVFDRLPKKDGTNRDKAYLIVETNQPTHVKQKAHPMVVITPVFDAAGDELRDIHLYPKNEEFDEEIKKSGDTSGKTEIVVGNENGYTVKYGDVIPYNIRIAVPIDLDKLKSLVVTDTPDQGLNYNDDLTIGNLVKDQDYKVEKVNNGFKVTFFAEGDTPAKASDALKGYQGKYIDLKYSMTVTKDVEPGEWTSNEAKQIVIDNNGKVEEEPSEGPKLLTGGYVFQKLESGTEKPLKDAKFQLVKVDANKAIKEYAKAPVDGVIEFETTDANAHDFTLSADAKLIIKGLELSEALPTGWSYAIVETVPPGQGYLYSKDPIIFTVTKDSYKDTTKVPTTVYNTKEGALPSTGGMGIVAFVVFGAGLMLVTFLKFRGMKREV